MKNIVLILALALSFLGCKKDGTPYIGTSYAILNGQAWKGKATSLLRNGKVCVFPNKEEENGYLGSLYINNFSRNFEKQQLVKFDNITPPDSVPNHCYFNSTVSLDETCDRFCILESDSVNNWVRITKQEDDFDEVWGEFSATLVRTGMTCNSGLYPDTLRFRSGTFHVKGLNK